MLPRPTQMILWRVSRWGWRLSAAVVAVVAAGVVFLRWNEAVSSLEDWRARLFLSVVGLGVGAFLAAPLVVGVRRFPRLVLAAFVAMALAQACYHTLVWSHWKPYVPLWRGWWVATVAAVWLAHTLWVLVFPCDDKGRLRRVILVAAGAAALLWAALGLRRSLLETPGWWHWGPLAAAALVSAGGSCVLWLRDRKRRPWVRPPLWAQVPAYAALGAGLLALGFYAGRKSAPRMSMADLPVSPLAHLPADELRQAAEADLQRLQVVAEGLQALERASADDLARVRAAQAAEGRSHYLPAEEDALRARFMSYLAYRAALLRLVAAYGGFASVPDPVLRERCFLLGFTAAASVMRASTMLVAAYGDDELLRRKLNEADGACALRAGEFERIVDAVANRHNAAQFGAMRARYEEGRAARAGAWPEATLAGLDGLCAKAMADLDAHPVARTRLRLERLGSRVKADVKAPVYDAQIMLSTLIGDTRVVDRPPFIGAPQAEALAGRLQPGDILLERRNWYASNAFLPGFWPHAALYLGTPEQLAELGLLKRGADGAWTSEVPAVRDRLAGYLAPAHDGAPCLILESVSEGVVFNSLAHSMAADYVAVLRPRLAPDRRATAIARAFGHAGKPYDFEFDFFSADKLVCTELVYRSYEGLLHFDLVRIMGRDTLPALEICRKFAAERGTPKQELDFVLFLDAVPEEGRAKEATVEDFCASAHRPRGFNE